MPGNGISTVVVEVKVAAVWPALWVAEAAMRHADRHCLLDPRRERARLDLQASIAILARAGSLDHPCRLPRDLSEPSFWLLPLHLLPGSLQESCCNNSVDSTWQGGRIAPESVIAQRVRPPAVCRGHLSHKLQTDLAPRALGRSLVDVVVAWPAPLAAAGCLLGRGRGWVSPLSSLAPAEQRHPQGRRHEAPAPGGRPAPPGRSRGWLGGSLLGRARVAAWGGTRSVAVQPVQNRPPQHKLTITPQHPGFTAGGITSPASFS
mmetsp:Transcript_51270/g.146397  ORF Transcript_51270/g.146397 Transcript_51270/m.146397 type:complete len:262 (-) Transcript_51270:575-1360(-)